MSWPYDQITDHGERAVGRLTSQYDDADVMRLLVQIEGEDAQTVEDALWTLLVDRWIDSAEGAQLDRVGEIVGENRQGRDDEAYRVAIRFRVSFNVSGGDPETIISAVGLITGATSVQLTEEYPAGVSIFVVTEGVPPALDDIVGDLLPAGVRIIDYTTSIGVPFGWGVDDGVGEDDAEALGFAEPPDAQDDEDAGALVELLE